MSCTVIYDGVNLGDYCKVVEYGLSALAGVETVMQQVPGRDGEAYLGSRLRPRDISVKLRLDAGSICPIAIQEKWAEVAAFLRKDGPRPLSFGGERYYMAVLAEETEIEQHGYCGDVTATFRCPDPVAYGAERSLTVPSGGSVSFVVGGTYPAAPVIEALAVRGTGGLWGIAAEDGDFLRVATGTDSPVRVELDCDDRTCKVGTTVALPTIDSDWLSLAPGRHSLANDVGSGDATVTWRERWL